MAAKKKKLKTYILTGDISHAGRVRVRAASAVEAIELAEEGNFQPYDEDPHCSFEFCGDADGGIEEED